MGIVRDFLFNRTYSYYHFCGVFFNDNDDETGNFSYLITLSALLMGLFPLVGSLVMEPAVLTRVYWVAEAILLLIQFLTMIFNIRRNPHYLFSLLLTLGIDAIIYFSRTSVMLKHDLPYYGTFSFELPVSVSTMTYCIYQKNR